MKIPNGAKIRVKKHITRSDLQGIGIGSTPQNLGIGIKKNNSEYREYSSNDIDVSFPECCALTIVIPETWVELVERPGHHLTNIFK